MKVSTQRLTRALQLRNAALRVLSSTGYDITIADFEKGYCHRSKQAKVHGLTIMCSRPDRQWLLDIWTNKKVFSIRWNNGVTPYVVAFRPGDWETILVRLDIAQTLDSVECSTTLKNWLIQ